MKVPLPTTLVTRPRSRSSRIARRTVRYAMPHQLAQQLLAALDLQALYHKKDDQVTIRATLTTATATVVTAIITDADISH